MEIKWIRLFYT